MNRDGRPRRSDRLRRGILAILVTSALGAVATAAGEEAVPPAAPKAWYETIAVDGFVSVSYSYNTNRPASGTNQLRVFDFDDNTFKIDVVTLTLQKAASKPGEAGFRVDAEAGASIPKVSSSAGLFQGQDFDLKQAFVSYVVPVGSGLRIDAGKFLTHFNYEFIESWDTPNDNATHSFTFGYAIPFTHTGVKAGYTFSDELAALAEICNGWDVVKDNNSSKTIGAELAWTPTKSVSVTANFITGPERANVDSDPRTVYELVAQWKLSDRTVFGLNALRGTERGAVVPGALATWSGLVGYARLGLSGVFALCLRGEYFSDPDGARTGDAQTLREVTLTPELRLGAHVVLRADLRIDWSSRRVFQTHDGVTDRQPTALLNAFYTF